MSKLRAMVVSLLLLVLLSGCGGAGIKEAILGKWQSEGSNKFAIYETLEFHQNSNVLLDGEIKYQLFWRGDSNFTLGPVDAGATPVTFFAKIEGEGSNQRLTLQRANVDYQHIRVPLPSYNP